MAKDPLKEKLAKLATLRSATDEELITGLRAALNDASNYIIAKAAAITGERYALGLIPNLLLTYDRLFKPEPTVDPLALGKHAIAQALKELDYREPSPFLRGLHHVQREAAWGKPVDVAAGLRGTCALALVGCDIDDSLLCSELVDHLATDPEKNVRIDVVRAIGDIGGEQGMLLLRFKALAGDPQAEVVGECFVALMQRNPRQSLAFVERFLESTDADLRFEAIYAIAGSRDAAAQAVVTRLWTTTLPLDVRRALLFSCAASRAPEAADFLLAVIAEPRTDVATWALTALATSRFRDDVAQRARAAATRDPVLLEAYAAAFC